MTQILADTEMVKRLGEATEPVTIVNDAGTVIGVYTPVRFGTSPYPQEEIERRRRAYRANPKGKSLTEILTRLEEEHS